MPARGSLEITDQDQAALRRWSAAADPYSRRAQRAQIVLLAAQGLPNGEIARRLGISRPVVLTWRSRYAEGGLAALADRPRSGRPRQASAAEIVTSTLRVAPRLQSATACARSVAAELGISPATVSRGWRAARVSVLGGGQVLFEADPPLSLSEQEILGICVRAGSAIALLHRSGEQRRGTPVRASRPRAGAGQPRYPGLAAMRDLIGSLPPGEHLHGIVAGGVVGAWGSLDARTAGMAWHIAPSAPSWLAVTEAVMCMSAGGLPGALPARRVAQELSALLMPSAGLRGWITWVSSEPRDGRLPAGPADGEPGPSWLRPVSTLL